MKRRPNSEAETSLSPTEVLEIFQARPDQAITFREIVQILDLPSDRRREARQILRRLLDEHRLLTIDRRRYSLPSRSQVVVGRLQAHRDGYGFLIPEDSSLPDIFLGKKEVRELMHRDRLALHLGKQERRRGSAPRVIEVLERAHRRIVGRYEVGPKDDRVVPDEPRLTREIRIPKRAGGGAREGQIVLAEITRYPTRQEGPEGKVRKVLGDADDPRLDGEIVIHKYDLPDAFPPAVLKQAAAIPDRVSPDLSSCRDLRHLNFFTIDGETARDFDDAVSLSREGRGRRKLWVSIADVSHYVKEGSALDKEALRRGTSVYFPDRALPMLPPELSTGICSLNPEEDRVAMTVVMEFDARGRPVDTEFFPSLIRSQARLTYTAVRDMLVRGDQALIDRYPSAYGELQEMADLARQLREQRRQRGAIDFDLPEPEILLDIQGQIEEIVRAERHIGHQIIEEFMIAANEAVARFLSEQGIPYLHRVHERPDEAKLENFKEFVVHLGYRFSPGKDLQPKTFQHLLERARGKPEEKSINYLLLRSLKQARYSEKELGHFALASRQYLHFTSPIRRYPDLVVHRLLQETLRSGMREKRREQWLKKLPAIAEHCSQRERVAMEAEREIVERKKVQFMRDKVGLEFNGYISGVLPFGIFVELENFFIEGLVHLTRLPEDRYQFLELRHMLVGERGGRTFRLGDRVRVRVEAADPVRRQIDFGLVV